MDGSAPGAVPTRRLRLRLGLLLAAGGIIFGLLLIEGVLRGVWSGYHLMPAVQFGWPDPATIQARYADDPDLFWVTRDYREKLRTARRTRPQIVFMGDSCTEFGTYPERTLERLAAMGSSVKTGVALATGGWSSEQGLEQLRRDIIPLHPRDVIIYFGWNDHWMALGFTDPELRRSRRLLWLSERSRLVQLLLKVRMGMRARHPERPKRVPPDRYQQNLETMSALAREAGITPIFVTAPSNHVAGREPAYLQSRHLNRLSDLIPVHQQYVEITRRAARESGGFLCDAAREFERLPGPHDALFMSDGIHFTLRGDSALAEIVSGCIAQALR